VQNLQTVVISVGRSRQIQTKSVNWRSRSSAGLGVWPWNRRKRSWRRCRHCSRP